MHTFNNFLELSYVWHIKQTFPKFENVLEAFVNKAASGINKTKIIENSEKNVHHLQIVQ